MQIFFKQQNATRILQHDS